MPGTEGAVVQLTGLVGEPGDKIVFEEDGTLRLIKAADDPGTEPDEPCEP